MNISGSPLTDEQTKKLLQAVREHKLEALLTVALVTGMRKGELLELRWTDIDFETMSLQVKRTINFYGKQGLVESEPKTSTGRRKVILPKFVIDVLKQHMAYQDEQCRKLGSKWQEIGFVFLIQVSYIKCLSGFS